MYVQRRKAKPKKAPKKPRVVYVTDSSDEEDPPPPSSHQIEDAQVKRALRKWLRHNDSGFTKAIS